MIQISEVEYEQLKVDAAPVRSMRDWAGRIGITIDAVKYDSKSSEEAAAARSAACGSAGLGSRRKR